MQRGRFLILIGILLVVMAVGLWLLVSNSDQQEDNGVAEGEEVTELQLPTPPPPTPVPTDRVVVALQRIPRGTRLVTDTVGLNQWVSLESWPQGWLTTDALISFDQVVGRIARSDIPRGTILTRDMLTDQAGDLVTTGSDAALHIPPDRVAIAIPVDHISSVGWSLRRGDHVDVLISFLMLDLDEEFQTELPNQASSLVTVEEGGVVQEGTTILQGTFGRIEQDPFGQPINVIPSEAHQRPRLVSQVTVRDAEVLNVGPWGELFGSAAQTNVTFASSTTTEGEGTSETPPAESESQAEGEQDTTSPQQVEILLEEGQTLSEEEVLREYLNVATQQPLLLIVTPQDALVLKWADEMGGAIHVVLRSFEDTGIRLPDTEAVTMQYMVDRFNIALPPGLAYGIEPAAVQLERSFLQLPEQLWNPWSTQTIDSTTPPR
jgi:Flp pilus assembly protein CpaB